jgi:hypothetical protein
MFLDNDVLDLSGFLILVCRYKDPDLLGQLRKSCRGVHTIIERAKQLMVGKQGNRIVCT